MSQDREIARLRLEQDEDAALARLLSAARPRAEEAREAALLDRIVAAAERTPRLAAPPIEPTTVKMAPPAITQRRSNRDLFGAAGLLAASLMIGFLLGQTPASESAMRGFEDVTGIAFVSAALDLAAAETSIED